MIKYWQMNAPMMIEASLQHLRLVLGSLALAVLLAIILVLPALHHQKWLQTISYLFSLIYAIPSFAFFVLLLPLTGLGTVSATIVLVAYAEYVLLRNFIAGIKNVDSQLLTTATGLGMTARQIFWRVQLPLALPAIFSGLQVALASTMAIATIAATINAGGLGQLLFEGLQTQQEVPLLWGILLTVILTLVCAGILQFVEWVLTHKWRAMI